MNYPPIQVESLFTEMVRDYPMGCVLTDKIPNPDFPNADYIFHHEKVVAELKRIEVDNLNSPNNQSKINAAIDKFYAEGKIKTKNVNEDNWRSLPDELTEIFYDITTHSIKHHVAKANKQIKHTKLRLGLESYKGVLIIVNDGVESYPPSGFIYSVFRLLENDFSGITFFIFFTANIFALSREHAVPMQYWIGMDMEKAGKMDNPLCHNLHAAWKNIVSLKTGLSSFNLKMNDVEGFWKAKNLPKDMF
jgi:hypothetical protein